MSGHVANHCDTAQLSDAEYLAWCQEEARKLFEALLAKRFPQLVQRKSRRP